MRDASQRLAEVVCSFAGGVEEGVRLRPAGPVGALRSGRLGLAQSPAVIPVRQVCTGGYLPFRVSPLRPGPGNRDVSRRFPARALVVANPKGDRHDGRRDTLAESIVITRFRKESQIGISQPNGESDSSIESPGADAFLRDRLRIDVTVRAAISVPIPIRRAGNSRRHRVVLVDRDISLIPAAPAHEVDAEWLSR